MDTASNYTETLEKTVRDLLERQDDLIRTAFTNQLTGLGNRGGFARSLEELWGQELPVTMAFIDIDNLKHCNDIFGHDEGNRYILQVSLYLKLYMKVDEAAFRIGGDEFAILSTIATEDDLAERLEHCRTVLLKNNDARCLTRLATEWHTPTPPWAKPQSLDERCRPSHVRLQATSCRAP